MQGNKFSFIDSSPSHRRQLILPSSIKTLTSKPTAAAGQSSKQTRNNKLRLSALSNLRESQTNKTNRSVVPLPNPITQRYNKSSLHFSKESIHQSNNLDDNPDKNPSQKQIKHPPPSSKKKNLKIISSFREGRKAKLKGEQQAESRRLLESFLCKSIEPLPAQRHLSVKQLKSPKNQKKIAENSERKIEVSLKQQFHLHRKVQNSSAPSPTNHAFLTKLKKKRVESNPHLLASIIKRKQEVLSKDQLYEFVKKIISKCAK